MESGVCTRLLGRRAGLRSAGVGGFLRLGASSLNGYYLPKLKREHSRAEQQIRTLIHRGGEFQPRGRHKQLARALATVLSPKLSPKERAFYSEVLVLAESEGDPTQRPTRGALAHHRIGERRGEFRLGSRLRLRRNDRGDEARGNA